MTEYDTDDELNLNENMDNIAECESIIPITVNSVNSTPVNNDDITFNSSTRYHKHCHSCYTAEVLVKGVAYVLNKRIKNSSPSIIPIERKYLNLTSIDDGFQEDNPSPIMSSACSDRDQGALSDASSEGFYCQGEFSHTCHEAICLHVHPFLNKLKKNFPLPNHERCTMLPKFNDKFYKSLEQLIHYFEEKFNSDSSTLLRSNAMDMNKMDIIQARLELNKILESIFSDKINWGRIVAMIGFVCELSCSAFMIQRQDLIEEYISTTVAFVDQNLWEWVSQHGGWVRI